MLLIGKKAARALSRFSTAQDPLVKRIIEDLQKKITNKQDVENNILLALDQMKQKSQG